jgi:hypothetical protein
MEVRASLRCAQIPAHRTSSLAKAPALATGAAGHPAFGRGAGGADD